MSDNKAAASCSRNGACLAQGSNEVTGEEVYVSMFACEHACKPVRCPNFALCKTKYPQWLADCCGGRCRNCHVMFGRNLVHAKSDDKCPVCLDNRVEFVLPSCTHALCIDCIKRIYFIYEDDDGFSESASGRCPLCGRDAEQPWLLASKARDAMDRARSTGDRTN